MSKKSFKPIGFANGDGGTGRGATMVRNIIFGDFPTVDVPVTVEARLATKDACILEAVKVFQQCGAGFKNSTASDDQRIKDAGLKSANIQMRPLAGAFALLRLLQGPGNYPRICGTLRYAHGCFYDEQSCIEDVIDGRKTAVIVQHFDLDGLVPFAKLAAEHAQIHGLHLILSSKSTIAPSELLFRKTIENIWKEMGLVAGEAKNWSGDYHHELTDIAIANLPIKTADGSKCSEGGFLHVADNANGDTSSDVIDLQHGNHVMGSTVYCEGEGGKIFTYEELPGGTADGKTTGELVGQNFLSPVGIIFAMASAFQQVNPDQYEFFNAVRKETIAYIETTEKAERSTEAMINLIAERCSHLLLQEQV